MASPQEDRSTYVTEMARELGIVLRAEDVGRIAGIFGNLARVAAQLRQAELGEDTLPAPVFQPITDQKP
jgi:1-carboxybiuret hydrolase subunit AtzG-like protein